MPLNVPSTVRIGFLPAPEADPTQLTVAIESFHNCVRSNQKLKLLGIIPILMEIHQGKELSLPDTETVLIAFPPGRGTKRGEYPAKIKELANGLKGK